MNIDDRHIRLSARTRRSLAALILAVGGGRCAARYTPHQALAPNGSRLCVRIGQYANESGYTSHTYSESVGRGWDGRFPCPECPPNGAKGALEELKSLGFETTLVERDEEALTGRCDLFFTFRASIEWPLNQSLYNYNISQPVLLDALLVDLRHGKQILYDGRYENKDARTKADGCIEGLQDGNINWALSPQGKSAIAKWTTQSLRRAVLLLFQEHKLVGEIKE